MTTTWLLTKVPKNLTLLEDISMRFIEIHCLIRMMPSMKICWVTLKFLRSKIKKNANKWKELQYANEEGYFKK